MNTVNLIGNLTRDPEVKALPSGTSVCDLGVAVNERYKDRDGDWTERANFFRVTVYGGQADSCGTYLAKGRQVGVSGRLRWESWEKDGHKREAVKVIADRVEFLGGGKRDQETPSDSPDEPESPPGGNDEIPF